MSFHRIDRGAARWALSCCLLALSACATQLREPPIAATAEAAEATATPPAPGAPAFEPGVELPEGEGREILVSSCLSCHELTALGLFKGFYSRDSWRGLVLTMVANGAAVDAAQVEILSDYLERYFGPDAK